MGEASMAWALSSGAGNDPLDYSDRYNTPLTNDQEVRFRKWAQENGRERDSYDYDIRGYWLENVVGATPETDTRGHLTDKYKKPNHPTFSSESKYSTSETPGGEWSFESGRDVYTPSAFVRETYGEDNLRRYFDRAEPNAKLNLNTKRSK